MNEMTISIAGVEQGNGQQSWFGKVRGLLRRGWQVLSDARMRRRQRLALAQLDERLLRDIGITREQARAESEKPIWRS